MTTTPSYIHACQHPLRDGSDCHGCRMWRALVDAEAVVEPDAVAAGFLNTERCMNALGDTMAHLLTETDRDGALAFLSSVYVLSRKYQEQHRRQDALAHPQGSA